jgi:hypothetical protein
MRSITHGVAEQAGSVTVVAAADRAAAESAAELAKAGITLTPGGRGASPQQNGAAS